MKKLMIFLTFFVLVTIGVFVLQTTVDSVNESWWMLEFSLFGKVFRAVHILIGFISTFISTMVVLLGIILFNRRRMEKRQKIKDELLVKYQELVVDYLYLENDDVKFAYRRLKELTNSKFKKQLLINQVVDVAKNLQPGDALDKIQILFYSLKLDKPTFRKIKHGPWHQKIKGIKEVCALSLADKRELFYKYANSKNDILRMEAQTGLVELSRFDEETNPFEFLTDLTLPFSRWEQIALHQVMVDRDISPPNFVEWLYSDNITITLFCLRMIKEYKQQDLLFGIATEFEENTTSEWVQNLAWHDDENVRQLAYEVMGDLKMVTELKEVRKLFKDETIDNKREMIRSMRKCADPTLTKFLKKIIDIEDDAEILVEGVRGIKDTKGGKAELDKMLKDKYKNYNIIIKHVRDRKIN